MMRHCRSWGTVLGLCLLACLAASGCSIRRYAVGEIADVVSRSGASFASDDDPELVKAAAPFSLKLLEGLLSESPRHEGLRVAVTSSFTQFAFAFVQQPADELEAVDLAGATELRTRARRLYLRAQRHGLRGLELKHPGFSQALSANPTATVRQAKRADVPLLFWTGAAWAAAISQAKDDPELVAQIPAMEALVDRALALNESYGAGAIHTFLITYEMTRQGVPGNPAARARSHFERAMALTQGKDAGPLVALAEAVDVQTQNVKEFESLLNQALAIDPESNPENQMQNLVMQRRARWLLSQKPELFLIENE